MKNNQTKDLLNEQLEKLIEAVETAGNWIKPFKNAIATGLPTNIQTKKYYSGINIFMLWQEQVIKGYNSSKWATFNQVKDLGGTVLKGEKSTTIFFFKPLEIEREMENVQTGETEKVKQIIPMIKSYNVFNINQTTLTDNEIIDNKETKELKHIENVKSFFDNLDFLSVKESPKGAFYVPTLDYIGIPNKNNFDSIESFYATLGHEFIHSTGHTSRLNRELSQKKESYAFEELIAEIGAIFLMAHLGLEDEAIQNNSGAYLKSWLKALKDDKKYLWKAGAEASKAFEYLINYANEKEILSKAS